MSFDRTKPVNGTTVDADLLRNNLNDLDDRLTAIPAGPPGPQGLQGIQGPPGADGAPGAQGPAGADGRSFNPRGVFESMQTYNRLDLVSYSGLSFVCGEDGLVGTSPGMDPRWTQLQVSGGGDPFPYNGSPQINGTVFVQGELRLFSNDPNGSAEVSMEIRREDISGALVPLFATRRMGVDIAAIKFDYAGFFDGMGNPSVQHGAVLIYDGMIGAYKPWNIARRTVQVLDDTGAPITIEVLCPPP